MARQLSELEDQLDHMERAARGEIDALLQPFSRLAAQPRRDWCATDSPGAIGLPGRGPRDGRRRPGLRPAAATRSPDCGAAAQSAADRVGRGRHLGAVRATFRPRPRTRAVEDYHSAREAADRQRVLDYATLDAAAALAETIESAQGSFAGLTANGNLSNTALQQAEVAAALSQGRINAGVAQVLAHQAAQEASRAQLAELARLERLAAWSESRARANAMAGTLRDAASRNRAALREGLLLKIPSFYGGN